MLILKICWSYKVCLISDYKSFSRKKEIIMKIAVNN